EARGRAGTKQCSSLETHPHGAEERVEAVFSDSSADHALVLGDIAAVAAHGATIVVKTLGFAGAQSVGGLDVRALSHALGNGDLRAGFDDAQEGGFLVIFQVRIGIAGIGIAHALAVVQVTFVVSETTAHESAELAGFRKEIKPQARIKYVLVILKGSQVSLA